MRQARQTAIVTGSSRGIGRAIAVRLLESGYSVALNYSTNEEQAAATLAYCRKIDPAVILIKADVSRTDQARKLVDSTVAEFGSLNVLVNNAARVIDKPALDMTEGDWDTVLDTNLKGAFFCAKYAAPYAEAGRRGDSQHRRVNRNPRSAQWCQYVRVESRSHDPYTVPRTGTWTEGSGQHHYSWPDTNRGDTASLWARRSIGSSCTRGADTPAADRNTRGCG